MSVNKVIINNDTVVDLTDTTAEADTVLNGEVFYTASGSRAVGSYVDQNNRRTFYGTCATAAGTAAKVVTLANSDGWELVPGVIVGIKFSATNTANNMTLNVNGSGAIGVSYISGTRYTGTTSTITGSTSYVFYYMYDGTYWVFFNHSGNYTNNSNTVPSAQCETAAATAAKTATCTNYTLTANTYLHFNIRYANTVAGAITMNVNSKGAKPVYINGVASSSSNHTLPAGSYIAFYNGTYWDFNTNGSLPGTLAIANGGTGVSTLSDFIASLGFASLNVPIPSTNCTIDSGGYIQVGKLVVLSIQITTTDTFYVGGNLLGGLPQSLIGNVPIMMIDSNQEFYGCRVYSTSLYPNKLINAGTYRISGAYISS